jgi:spore germination protein YaaH
MQLKPKQQKRLIVVVILFCLCIIGGLLFQVLDNASAKVAIRSKTPVTTLRKTKTPVTTPPTTTPTTPPTTIGSTVRGYWIYPGEPACKTINELQTITKVGQLKSEFATILADGTTKIITQETAGCNALSTSNIELYKTKSTSQFITVSSGEEGFSALTKDTTKQTKSVETLTALVEQTNFTGIELDFEGYSSWTPETYSGYKSYITKLGNALRTKNRKLMIDAPAIYNDSIQRVFQFKYSDFNSLPVDYVTIMAYDYQFDYGGGSPVTEDKFLIDSINKAKNDLTDDSKIQVGLPTYGYTALEGDYRITILTKDQVFAKTTPEQRANATRIPSSQELIIKVGSQVYVWQDQQSIQHKINLTKAQGIDSITFWHLGGNELVAQ